MMPAEGEARLGAAIAEGNARERFARMVAAQGGPIAGEDLRAALPAAPGPMEVRCNSDGILKAVDGRALGMAVVRLGGGRLSESDRIDPSVGLSHVARLGSKMAPGTPLARIHAASRADAERAAAEVAAAFTIGDGPFEAPPLVRARLP